MTNVPSGLSFLVIVTSATVNCLCRGREGGRERGREGEREKGRIKGKEGEREGEREGGKEGGREGERGRKREEWSGYCYYYERYVLICTCASDKAWLSSLTANS